MRRLTREIKINTGCKTIEINTDDPIEHMDYLKNVAFQIIEKIKGL